MTHTHTPFRSMKTISRHFTDYTHTHSRQLNPPKPSPNFRMLADFPSFVFEHGKVTSLQPFPDDAPHLVAACLAASFASLCLNILTPRLRTRPGLTDQLLRPWQLLHVPRQNVRKSSVMTSVRRASPGDEGLVDKLPKARGPQMRPSAC